MVMVRATKTSEAQRGKIDGKLLADMGRFNEELIKAGVMFAGDGLKPSSAGARVKFTADDKRSVVDGPFAETKELIAGFWLWKCASRDEAVSWARKCPSPFPGEACELEIRQLYEPEDFL
jgi:hypothetical protein